MSGSAGDHAVVVGAGLAGLLSAHVLAGRFARVTVVERDQLPQDGPVFRPGIPQSRHVHVLWARGLRLIESQLPGITEELLASGAGIVDAPADTYWLSPADWFRPISGAPLLAGSRELIEWTIRRRVMRGERVRFLTGREVTGLVPSPDDASAVHGVTLRRRGRPDSGARTEQLEAGFVLDASGRTSRAPAWLEELGHPAPSVTRCDAQLAYSSRYFQAPADTGHDWKAMYLQARSVRPRAAVVLRIEGRRWLVTLFGNGEHAPPTGDEEFLEFTRTLRSPILYEALREAVPLSSAAGFRNTANEWRHYESLPSRPDGFVVLGDAAYRFNPVYGHGMTVAALAAHSLAESTRGLDPGGIRRASQRIQRANAAAATPAWEIAVSGDRRHADPGGYSPGLLSRVRKRYMAHVLAAANVDPTVARRLFDVLSLSAPPDSLLSPATLIRVLVKWHLPTSPATNDHPPHHAPAGTGSAVGESAEGRDF